MERMNRATTQSRGTNTIPVVEVLKVDQSKSSDRRGNRQPTRDDHSGINFDPENLHAAPIKLHGKYTIFAKHKARNMPSKKIQRETAA